MSLRKAFAGVAFLESCSWILLLISMFFTYVVQMTWGDGAISQFGMIHGWFVIAYVALLVVCLIRFRWGWGTIGLDFAALFVPGLGFLVAKWTLAEERNMQPEPASPPGASVVSPGDG